MIAGLLTGLLPGVPRIRVPPDVVSLIVLPPLLYAASEGSTNSPVKTQPRDATIGRVCASLQARIGRTRARIDGSHGQNLTA